MKKLNIVVMEHIRDALELHDGNKSQAALALGITNKTLYNYIPKLEDAGIRIRSRYEIISEAIENDVDVEIKIKKEIKNDIDREPPASWQIFPTNEERLMYLDNQTRLPRQ